MKKTRLLVLFLTLFLCGWMIKGSSVQAQSIDTREFLPYIQYVNYQYQGDEVNYASKDFILEYPMNDQGISQITMVTAQEVSCHLYQLRSDGFYELATIYDYNEVEDLRDETDITQAPGQSLILPRMVEVGQVFYSGYQEEYRNTVLDIVTDFQTEAGAYPQVIIIEQSPVDLLSERYIYYFAPSHGLFLVEQIQANGSKLPVYTLSGIQGALD